MEPSDMSESVRLQPSSEPSSDTDYQPLSPASSRPRLPWLALSVMTLVALAAGVVVGYASAPGSAPAPHEEELHTTMAGTPTACDGWEERCRQGADAAAAQGAAPFWPSALCAESPVPQGPPGKLSCSNRAAVCRLL